MRLLLDTNRYSDLARGEALAMQVAQAAAEIFIPFIVLGELRGGFAAGARQRENEARLSLLLQRPTVRSLFADSDTTHHYATLFNQLRRQGTPIPTNDIWIAALGVQHSLVLFSRDAHFRHIPQLARV
ncbi:MAG TPA: type II toxin-antitoxin system VapC family toxin [Tepidisphaeraceae bacterium]|jgi:tRNA(fMet)-specific endonuclease VapC|nr:type II toxin-antitoxin system VapC family toxin [Tepidisphaeraceae bacterium]